MLHWRAPGRDTKNCIIRRPMDSTRPTLVDPLRLHDDDTDAALRRDLAASRDAVAIGIDHATVLAELLARIAATPRRDACG
jgi:hypothetical protein